MSYRGDRVHAVLDAIEDPDDLRRLLQAALLLGANLDLAELLQHIADEARRLIGARYAALGVLDRQGNALERFVVSGIERDVERVLLAGPFPQGRGVLGALIDDPRPLRMKQISDHPGSVGFPPGHPPMSSFLGVPIRIGDRVYGNLYLTEKTDEQAFSQRDEILLEALAAVAALAVENARLHQRAGDVAVYEERERLARDLHDGVIQRLFAIGLGLQGLSASTAGRPVAGTLTTSVEDLDETIRQIRTSIFELGGHGTSQGIRSRILELVDELRPMLGFDVPVTFDGAVEAGVDEATAEHLLATVREGLTNVARHAQATSARVRLSVADGRCRLEISDDGVGFAEGSSREASDGEFADRINGLGLTILARRAERLGGTLETSINEPRGAALVWDVPVAVPGISATLVNPRLPL